MQNVPAIDRKHGAREGPQVGRAAGRVEFKVVENIVVCWLVLSLSDAEVSAEIVESPTHGTNMGYASDGDACLFSGSGDRRELL